MRLMKKIKKIHKIKQYILQFNIILIFHSATTISIVLLTLPILSCDVVCVTYVIQYTFSYTLPLLSF